jgi:hypothetical protein
MEQEEVCPLQPLLRVCEVLLKNSKERMMKMKLRFKIVAICVAAVLLLSMLPSGMIYANEELNGIQIEQNDSDSQGEAQADSVATDTAEQTTLADIQEEALEASSASDTEKTPSPDLSGDVSADIADFDTEQTTPADQQEENPEESSSDLQENDFADEEFFDESFMDQDTLLIAWVQEHPDQLSALYAGDPSAIAALADILGEENDAVCVYVEKLKLQNDALVLAIENGTDVLDTISMYTAEEAAEALAVDEIAIELFNIKLGYVSGLLSDAMEQADENDQLDAWMQEQGEALEDEQLLQKAADSYDVEPAVLAALLQNMGIEPIAETASASLTRIMFCWIPPKVSAKTLFTRFFYGIPMPPAQAGH